ncbi:MAG: carbohydrate ABC transporter permease [Clostridia bacterium]|nr:carbohydrate ABC transporter permease [Clostridia bacterium]
MAQAVSVQERKRLREGPSATSKTLVAIAGFVLFTLFMLPFVLVVINSAKTTVEISLNPVALPTDWSQIFTNVAGVVNNPNFSYWSAFLDSVIITTLSLVVIVVFSAMGAWVLVRNKAWWSTALFMVLVAAMVVPFQVIMLPLVQWLRIFGDLIGIGLNSNYLGIVLCYLGFGASLSMFIFHGFIKGVPLELEEAADIDGCSRAGVFFRIVLPLLQPTAVTVMILNGIWIWNDFLLPLLVLGANGRVQTLPLAVASFAGAFIKQWDLILTSTLLAMLPIIVLFLFAQRYIIKGMVEGSIK